MNDASDLVTRLVVGERLTIELGRPVTQEREGTLELKGGRWVASGAAVQIAELLKRVRRPAARAQGSLVHLGAAASRTPSSSRDRWQRYMLPATAALTVVLAIVSVTGYWRSGGAASADPKQAGRAAEQVRPVTQAVTVVQAPYDQTAPALPLAPAGALAEQAPISPVPPQVVAAAAQSAAPVAAAATAAGGQAARPPAPSASAPGKGDDKPRPSAVLVDEGPAPTAYNNAAGKTPTATAPAPAQAPSAKPGPTPVAAPAGSKAPAGPALPRGTGLVAITPDGKFAVFTNPKTRMPEQFRVGEQLPNGETLKSIDQNEGRVVTGAKEYTLD